MKLAVDYETGTMRVDMGRFVYADRGYRYWASGKRTDGRALTDSALSNRLVARQGDETLVTGALANLNIDLRQTFEVVRGVVTETLSIKNAGTDCLSLEQVEFGFCADLSGREAWRLCAVPFKVQLDGSRHDYSADDLREGKFKNAVFDDPTRKYMPALSEEGALRSEAWAWNDGERGVVVIKYSNDHIELSVANPVRSGDETRLKFGGAGFCLYGEPTGARLLAPGCSFTFGQTIYIGYEGDVTRAYTIYREFLDARGHTFPADYNPPVNWNELYDIGWYHSKQDKLKKHYTRNALLNEAAKAREVGCEMLYLDPGWEVCEGTTQWDEARLGPVKSLAETLRADYGLQLGYRTILRTYQDRWPKEWLVRHRPGPYEPVPFGEQSFWEVCACAPVFQAEKLKRILEISKQGVRFMMVDEFDWRGPCSDSAHGHPVPTTPLDHTLAVYRLCDAIREACPGLTIECHDPIWPWATCIYVPTYFKQGFGERGSYDENWGFEYMWDCLNDLKSGKALALYYYNLGCNVPLYLHITMAADNDACVFFWWCASTVRHLGIGGKTSSRTIELGDGLPPWDKEKRFAAYKGQMVTYRDLKPYFVRGTFHGISENAHLHTLPGKHGGVLNLFNLTDQARDVEASISFEQLQTDRQLNVLGAIARWTGDRVVIRQHLPPMSPAVVRIGDCAISQKGDLP